MKHKFTMEVELQSCVKRGHHYKHPSLFPQSGYDQLYLTTHSICGEASVALLAEHRAAASTNDDVVVEAENSSESEDGDAFIDIIGEDDL
ncbi:hypothetical protein ON010_g10773 [Phytophthora cinnamomi]|nr:hypothetical protein ON010_g10773 [Phytophthora cinnamomi]